MQSGSSAQEEPTGESPPSSEKHDATRSRRRKELRLDLPEPEPSKDAPELHEPPSKAPSWRFLKGQLPDRPTWIAANSDWSHLKPILRCALAAWIALFFVIIPRLESTLGQASFLVVIVSFLDPPGAPFMVVLEKEIALVGFVTLAWAWVCLGIKLANLARSEFVLTASTTAILGGEYIEAAPTAIMAVFLYLGSTFFLYIKGTVAPGPYLIAAIFACITLDISLTVAPMFPYPYYAIGEAIVIPITVHAAIALVVSFIIVPETVNAQYNKRLRTAFLPLADALDHQRETLPKGDADVLDAATFRGHIRKSEALLPLLAASAQAVPRDISWGRFSATDLVPLHELVRKLPARLTGMMFYYELIDATRERFPVTPIPSRVQSIRGSPRDTPLDSPAPSRPPSPIDENEPTHASTHPSPLHESATPNLPSPPSPMLNTSNPTTPTPSITFHRRNSFTHLFHRTHKRHGSHGHSHGLSLHAHFHFPSHSFFHAHTEEPVGVFESQKYLNLETRFSHPNADALMEQAVRLLAESAVGLMEASSEGVRQIAAWLKNVNRDRFEVVWSVLPWAEDDGYDEKELFESRSRLEKALETFRSDTRHRVLDPYRAAFEKGSLGPHGPQEPPPHRYLYQSFVYQYHLMHFAQSLLEGLAHIEELEGQRKNARLWLPAVQLTSLFSWSKWAILDLHSQQTEDEDPEVIPGMEDVHRNDLGEAGRRDPDAFPPANVWEAIGHRVHALTSGLGGGNMVFAMKGGVLTLLLSLPSFIKSSAGFAYKNKFVWAIFMGQLTITRFRGETTFGFVTRMFSTFFGAIIGLAMWYISSGDGPGNPYGLSALCAVCFPFFFFFLLYHPWPMMRKNILLVTITLVVGYSWQDEHLPTLSSPGVGWDVAWRRFVLVSVGVFAAFVVSFLPPSTTLREYQRRGYATTVAELGTIYCAVVSHAYTKQEDDLQSILKSLAAIRAKLDRSIALSTNIVYEFSLRGRWPTERYNKIRDLQFQISYLIAHLLSVVEYLEPAWTRAFLRRTRLSDPDFQGSLLAVLSLISTALRLGTPLPQITPCPLLERYMHIQHGFSVVPDNEEDYGLPKQISLKVLEDEQYLYFSMGASTVYGLVTRLDMLMMATKELVGEQYHLHGVGLPLGPLGMETRSRPQSVRSTV